MQLIWDNLVAIIVGGAVLLMMATMTLRNVEPKAESFHYYDMRVHMNTLTETIRQDFVNIGAGTDSGEQMLFAPVAISDSITSSFRFRATLGLDESAVPENLKYELTEVAGGCAMADGATVSCYRLARFLCDAGYGSCEASGTSTPSITMFAVKLLDDQGNPTIDPTEARGVRVRLAAVPPDGRSAVVPQVRWESSFRPVNLERQ